MIWLFTRRGSDMRERHAEMLPRLPLLVAIAAAERAAASADMMPAATATAATFFTADECR